MKKKKPELEEKQSKKESEEKVVKTKTEASELKTQIKEDKTNSEKKSESNVQVSPKEKPKSKKNKQDSKEKSEIKKETLEKKPTFDEIKADLIDAPEIEDKSLNAEKEKVDKNNSNSSKKQELSDEKVVQEFRSISRRSFLGLGIAGVLGGGTYYWLRNSTKIGDVEAAFRYSHQFNEFLSRKYFSHSRLAIEYPKSAVQPLRANGYIGVAEDSEMGDWKLRVSGTQKSPKETLTFSIEDIKKLPKQDISINFKCIEGWSRVMNYVGVRFSDFISINKLFDADKLTDYVSMKTPDGEYYVGLDIESAMHPQTLLCYEMNGKTLTPENGFPLRLLIPTKYGTKNLKRIGTIEFTNKRPDDYWAERGYDWYGGL